MQYPDRVGIYQTNRGTGVGYRVHVADVAALVIDRGVSGAGVWRQLLTPPGLGNTTRQGPELLYDVVMDRKHRGLLQASNQDTLVHLAEPVDGVNPFSRALSSVNTRADIIDVQMWSPVIYLTVQVQDESAVGVADGEPDAAAD